MDTLLSKLYLYSTLWNEDIPIYVFHMILKLLNENAHDHIIIRAASASGKDVLINCGVKRCPRQSHLSQQMSLPNNGIALQECVKALLTICQEVLYASDREFP